MANLYIQEPPTFGKVLLTTTVGDIDIELWSKETPKACRNFVQLCLENYYNGTCFHRVVKGFMAQGGDPNGDGTGGSSIYGKPFKDEFHSRLRFVRRGLVAMANGGKDDNASQFFFTFAACPELQNKNTIFGKVSGDTLFNMLKLEDSLVDGNDCPIYPQKIISSTVLLNPFPDIVPRSLSAKHSEAKPIKIKGDEQKKNFNLLSFGEEAEEEEAEVQSVSKALKGKSKSIHDLGNDPNLSSVSAASLYSNEGLSNEDAVENVRKKLKIHKSSPPKNILPDESRDDEPSHDTKPKAISSEREEVRRQIQMLKNELRKKKDTEKSKTEEEVANESSEKLKSDSHNPLLEEFHKQQVVQKEIQKEIRLDKSEREKKTMALLAKFQNKLKAANEAEDKNEDNAKRDNDGNDDNDDIGDLWLTHTLCCTDTTVLAKDANIRPDDWYDIRDPRNPINQRRRQEKKAK